MRSKPLIIAIEGIDGSGKHTQAELLKEHMLKRVAEINKNHPDNRINCNIYVLSFPRYGETISCAGPRLIEKKLFPFMGELDDFESRTDYLYSMATLFMIDRVQFSVEQRSQMNNNPFLDFDIVICDRYSGSNAIHLGGEYLRMLYPDLRLDTYFTEDDSIVRPHSKFVANLDTLEHGFLKTLKPDMNILMDIHPSLAMQNITNRSKEEHRELGVFESQRKLEFATLSARLTAYNNEWSIVPVYDGEGKNMKMKSPLAISDAVSFIVDSYFDEEMLLKWAESHAF